MNSDLSLDFLRVVEQAAIACAHTMGQGDGHQSDHAAVEAMRESLDTVPIDGTIVIGEGERDEAPMLIDDCRLTDLELWIGANPQSPICQSLISNRQSVNRQSAIAIRKCATAVISLP